MVADQNFVLIDHHRVSVRTIRSSKTGTTKSREVKARTEIIQRRRPPQKRSVDSADAFLMVVAFGLPLVSLVVGVFFIFGG